MACDDADRPADRRIPAGDDFLSAAEIAAITPEILIERTTALKPLVAEHAAEAERQRRPSDAVWRALRASGYFYLFVPRRFGGLQFDSDTYIDATLPLAEADASTGWVASFCAEHNWFIAQMPEAGQADIWGRSPYVIAPSVNFPPGTATPVDGGYRLSGRWKWGTGVMHADWVMLSGLVAAPDGPPALHIFALPAAEVEVVDTWQMAGMAATGSNDIVARDVFVPSHRQFAVAPVRSGRGFGHTLHDDPKYAAPMLPNLCIAAAIPVVGAALEPIAIGALDEPDQTGERIRLRADIAHAVSQCVEAVRGCCEAVGSSVHALSHPLQRALRDVQVMQSHIVYDLDVATELHGRALVGLPPNSLLT